MKSFIALLAISLCIASAYADCDDDSSWLKNLGCQIKEGAKDLSESAKTWPDKIGSTAKEVGQTVAEKYDQLKHKLTDDNNSQGQAQSAAGSYVIENAPTEKVPLAPLAGEARAAATPQAAATGEQNEGLPISFDERFLFQLNDCPKGSVRDHKNNCRPATR